MDTSETYIKMCDCPEIQERWQAAADFSLFPSFVLDKLTGAVSIAIWTPKSLSNLIGTVGNMIIVSIEHKNERNIYIKPGEHGTDEQPLIDTIWLPRQDQLQEMVRGERHMHLLAHEFAVMFHGSDSPFDRDLHRDNYTVDADNSMEQMWLAFYMKEKHGKTWNGEVWKVVD